MSKNESVNWSIGLLKRYEDLWDWEELSKNKSLPWSIDLINTFQDRWNYDDLFYHDWFEWSEQTLDKYANCINWKALSFKNDFRWTDEFIYKYKDYLYFSSFSSNINIPWSLKFFIMYESKFELFYYPQKEFIWDKVFESLNDDLILKILSESSNQINTVINPGFIAKIANPNLKREKLELEQNNVVINSEKVINDISNTVIVNKINSKNNVDIDINIDEIIPERLFHDSEKNKFWAIYLNGSVVVINFGKLREYGDQKKYSFNSYKEAKEFYDTEIIKVLDQNFNEVEYDIDPTIISIKNKLKIIGGLNPYKAIVRNEDGDITASKFCGKPALIINEEWPCCRSCEAPLVLFLQLNLKELPNDFDYNIGEGVFQYFNCPDFYCGNTILRVIQYEREELNYDIEIPETEFGYFQPKVIVGWKKLRTEYSNIIEKCKKHNIELTKEELTTLDRYEKELEINPTEGDKLGGYGIFYNARESECPICDKKMRLIFQIESEENIDYSYSDLGRAYLSQCPDHKEEFYFDFESG